MVVDDDPGMLEGLLAAALATRLRTHPAFVCRRLSRSHTDFEKVVCVILDINLNDGSGIELGHHLQSAGISVPIIYMTGSQDAAVRAAALGYWVHRISNQAVLHGGTD